MAYTFTIVRLVAVSVRILSTWLLPIALALVLAACGGGGGSSGPTVTMVTVTPAVADVELGQQLQLSATVKDAMGNVLTVPVTWTSSNPAIATVNTTGLVMGVTIGNFTVTATSEGQTGTASLFSDSGVAFAAVTLGNNHTCGLTTTGIAAYCWGDNRSGQLGNGTMTNSAAPVLVPSVGPGVLFASISAGGEHTCAVTLAGAAYCWGDNSSGELGNGTTTNSAIPVPVSGGQSYVTVSAGGHHTCGVSVAGVIYCWGDNTSGQLGNGTTTNSTTPVAVVSSLSPPWNQVSAGSGHTCGINAAPTIQILYRVAYCWGDNSAGQFGNNTTTSSNTPVMTFTGVFDTFVSAGTLYSCVSNEGGPNGNAFCSGNNIYGQLGSGTTASSLSLVAVIIPTGFPSGISAGADHACGVVDAGNAYCWGNNSSGQLGNGTNTNSATPSVVVGGLNWAMVSAGGGHTCGVTSKNVPSPTASGGVYCWGDNTYGQLGNTWTTSSSIPVNVTGYTRQQ